MNQNSGALFNGCDKGVDVSVHWNQLAIFFCTEETFKLSSGNAEEEDLKPLRSSMAMIVASKWAIGQFCKKKKYHIFS